MLDWIDFDELLWTDYHKMRAVFGPAMPDWDQITYVLDSQPFKRGKSHTVGYMKWQRLSDGSINRDGEFVMTLHLPYFQAVEDVAGRDICMVYLMEVIHHEFCHAVNCIQGVRNPGHDRYFRDAMRRLGHRGESHTPYDKRGDKYYLVGTNVAWEKLNDRIKEYSR